jgi:hypothetical protein
LGERSEFFVDDVVVVDNFVFSATVARQELTGVHGGWRYVLAFTFLARNAPLVRSVVTGMPYVSDGELHCGYNVSWAKGQMGLFTFPALNFCAHRHTR